MFPCILLRVLFSFANFVVLLLLVLLRLSFRIWEAGITGEAATATSSFFPFIFAFTGASSGFVSREEAKDLELWAPEGVIEIN